MSSKRPSKKAKLEAGVTVCEDTLGLHSVSDESRRQIYNATCKALNAEEKQLNFHEWRGISEQVLPEVFYPVELPGVDSNTVTFYMCDVRKCFQVVVEKCPNYATMLQDSLSKDPSTIFNMVLYNDEATGGNVLAPSSAKKVSLWYFSLKQLGFLWHDSVWHPLCLLQHQQFDQIQGGFSCAAKHIIMELMKQNLNNGFPVQFSDRMVLLRLNFSYMISDLDSIRYVLDAKGSAAIRCCVFCKNAIKRDTHLDEYDSFFQDISSHNLSGFYPQSDAEIFEVIDQLNTEAANLSKSALQKKEKASGFNCNPNGFLNHQLTRSALPPSSFLLDTMHLYWSNGIVSWEVVEMFNRWQQTGLGDLQEFLQMDWKTTLGEGSTPSWRKRLGSDYNFSGATYKGTASNLTLFLPLFHYFLSRLLPSRNLLQKEMQCLDTLRRIAMELRRLQYCQNGLAIDRLQYLQVLHQKQVVDTYGKSFVKPKHHCRFHAAEQMQRVQFHCDCFATERKHKQYKSHIGLHRFDPVAQDGAKYGQLVLRAIMQHHVSGLAKSNFGTTLLGKVQPSDAYSSSLNTANCLESTKMQHEGKTYERGNVLLGEHPGIVVSSIKANDQFYLTLQLLETEESNDFWSCWRITQKKKLVHASMVGRGPMWWLQLRQDRLLCLHWEKKGATWIFTTNICCSYIGPCCAAQWAATCFKTRFNMIIWQLSIFWRHNGPPIQKPVLCEAT